MAKGTTLRGTVYLKESSLSEVASNRILTYNSSTGEVTYRSAIDASGYITSTLTSGNILVGNVSNVATSVAMSGDGTISNAGVFAIGTGVIVNTDVNASAAIAYSKLNLSGAILNADINAGAGIVYSKLTLTGSIVNADINSSAAIARSKIAVGSAYRVVTNNASGALVDATAITAGRALISDGNGIPAHSNLTTAKLEYSTNLTGDIQAQLDDEIATQGVSAVLKSPTAGEDGYAITWDDGLQQYTLTDPVVQGIPTGGATSTVLMKDSGTNYDASWTALELSHISDITALAADVNILGGIDALGVTTTDLEYIIGLDSNAQDQIDQ